MPLDLSKIKDWQALSIVGMILGIAYLLEFYIVRGLTHAGTVLCSLEVIFGLLALGLLLRKKHQRPWIIISYFALIALADAAYYAVFYVFKLPRFSYPAIFLTSLPYGLGYLCGTLALLSYCTQRKRLFADLSAHPTDSGEVFDSSHDRIACKKRSQSLSLCSNF
jgi:hypothetical protein